MKGKGDLLKKEIIIFQVFLMYTVFIYGGFYEFAVYLGGVLLIVLGIYLQYTRKRIVVRLNYTIITLLMIVIFYGISIFYAVDCGMAWIGFLKYLVLLPFLLLSIQFSSTERDRILQCIPIAGSIIVLFGIFSGITGIMKDQLFLSGRFGGTFQYSNTMALFLLIGIIILHFMEADRREYVCVSYFICRSIINRK